MYNNLKQAFESLIKRPEFYGLMSEYRFRFGIPSEGFKDINSDQYKNWINEAHRKTDYLKDQFLFIGKRCRNLVPDRNDPVPLVLLAYYFLYDKLPDLDSEIGKFNLSVTPSGLLGNFDITITAPFNFSLEELDTIFNDYKEKIENVADNAKLAVSIFSTHQEDSDKEFEPESDLLATTPGNGSDIVDRVHRDMAYLAEFGRIVLRGHLQNMKDEDFVIRTYQDKNKPLFFPVQHMGTSLLARGLYPIAEEYWNHVDNEIQNFNNTTGKRVNRGIPLANMGVSQIAQGKVIEGLFNIYRGYEDDHQCLEHLPDTTINPEQDMSNSVLYTQFEKELISNLFNNLILKYKSVFQIPTTDNTLSTFIISLQSDKKLLFYMIIYRFSFSFMLNEQLTTLISRSEILRSLAELALWFEDELKRKDPTLGRLTLNKILCRKLGISKTIFDQYTFASSLDELSERINNSLSSSDNLEMINARVIASLRNFAGHNLEVHNHQFYSVVDEVLARILSFILFAKSKGWI